MTMTIGEAIASHLQTGDIAGLQAWVVSQVEQGRVLSFLELSQVAGVLPDDASRVAFSNSVQSAQSKALDRAKERRQVQLRIVARPLGAAYATESSVSAGLSNVCVYGLPGFKPTSPCTLDYRAIRILFSDEVVEQMRDAGESVARDDLSKEDLKAQRDALKSSANGLGCNGKQGNKALLAIVQQWVAANKDLAHSPKGLASLLDVLAKRVKVA